MTYEEKIKEIQDSIEKSFKEFVDKPYDREAVRQSVNEWVKEFLDIPSGDFARIKGNIVEINVKKFADLKFQNHPIENRAKILWNELYPYYPVGDVQFQKDGYGFLVTFLEPVDYISIEIKVNDVPSN